jgi:hypothetical protein
VETLGRFVGWLVTGLVAGFRSKILVYLLVAVVFVFAAPVVTDYWATHVHIGDVPLSVNVFMLISTAFLLVFCMALYLGVLILIQGRAAARPMTAAMSYTIPPVVRATGGDFIPTDDAKMRDREDLEILKSKGIIQETDVEGLASEIGHATLMRTRGRTE